MYIAWKCFEISQELQKIASCHVLWLKKQKTAAFLEKPGFPFVFFMDQTRPVSGFEGFSGTDTDHHSTR